MNARPVVCLLYLLCFHGPGWETPTRGAEVLSLHVANNNLFTFITPHLAKVQNPNDVHFDGEGYDLLGKRVATAIQDTLK